MTRSYPDRPFVGVGAVVWRNNRVLLVRRAKPPRQGEWSLPGGVQELGESVRDAVAREVREETGVAVRVSGLIDVVDSIMADGDGRVLYHHTLIDFAADWTDGEARAGDDAAEVRWVSVDELGKYHLWPETERIIRAGATRS